MVLIARIWLLLVLLRGFGLQPEPSALRLIVQDVARQPIAGVQLHIADMSEGTWAITTDAQGSAAVVHLVGASAFVRDAFYGGHPLIIEPTTPKQGLRLGLIPGRERVVTLLLDDGHLFMTPEAVFSGSDPSLAQSSLDAAVPVQTTMRDMLRAIAIVLTGLGMLAIGALLLFRIRRSRKR